MGLFGDMLKGARMKDPVRGQAQVVSCTGYHGDATWQNCRMQLVVQADGVPPTATQQNDLIRHDRWPTPGMTLPVVVDRADPERVKIQWDEVESSRDRSARNAEALAAAMRGEAPGMPFGGIAAGGANVINLSGGDLSRLSPEQRAKLRSLGIDPAMLAAQQDASQAQATHAAQPPPPPPRDPGSEADERLARLAKLGELRAAGVLTPEEFEAQKRRILEA